MTKTTYATLIFIVAVATVAILTLKKMHPPKTLLRCDTDLTTQIHISSEITNKAVSRTKVYFFVYRNGKGFIRLNGSVEYKGKFYILDRELWYTYSDADGNTDDTDDDGIYTLRFTRDLKHIEDSVPYEIWQHFLQTEDPNISYHTTIKRIVDNLYLISTLPSPTFVCRGY